MGIAIDKLPYSVQREARRFTEGELRRLCRRVEEPEVWGHIGALGIGRHMISLGGSGIRFKNIRRISLNFHPLREGGRPGTVVGKATLVLELARPHVLIEEPLFFEDIAVFYRISQKEIAYRYPRQAEWVVGMLQECLEQKVRDLTPYREEICRMIREYEAEKMAEEIRRRAWEAGRREEAARRAQRAREEARRREQEARRREEKRREEESGKKESRSGRDAAWERARDIFQVGKQYTRSELKAKRRSLLKKYHPDAGGSVEMAQKINMAYDLLVRYAAA